MLASLCDVLHPARRGGYAVGLFNTVNLEMARGVIAAAEELRSPVIIGTAEVLLPFAPLDALTWFLLPLAQQATVPVVVHFDHGLTFERCMEALKLGIRSIMFDCSQASLEENTRKVRELTRIAHAFGANVEAELGHVGLGIDSAETLESHYTDPKQVETYVKATGVDALAIAAGTAHGPYHGKPCLDFGRIEKIASLTDVPLVLHGGSGLSDEDFRRAIACGISKINIFTDINEAAAAGAASALQVKGAAGTQLMMEQIRAVREAAMAKMRLFGSCGKA